MHEDSPPPFVVFHTPRRSSQPQVSLYQRGLEVVGVIHEIVQTAGTRFYLRDRLDRAATNLVFELGRAADAPTGKWRSYRAARVQASAVATVLDILTHQQAANIALLMRAQTLVRDLLADVTPLCNG